MSLLNHNYVYHLKYSQLSPIKNHLLEEVERVQIFADELGEETIIFSKTNEIFCFGSNSNGRLGFLNGTRVEEPYKISELSGKKILKAEFSQQMMAVLTDSGEVYSSGIDKRSVNDSLISKMKSKANFSKINIQFPISDIKCCNSTLFLLAKHNKIYALRNEPDVMTDINQMNGIQNNAPEPLLVVNQENIVQISTGSHHILALSSNGVVYAWKLNDNNNDNSSYGSSNDYLPNNPHQILRRTRIFVKQISCGFNHNLLLTSNDLIYSFGYNAFGQLGTGNTSVEFKPKQISFSEKVVEIYGVQNMSLALTTSNSIYVWGQTKLSNILSPLKTDFKTFQEAIDVYCPKQVTYKPLTLNEILIKKSVNRVIETMSKAFNNPKNSDLKFKVKRKSTEKYDFIFGHKWFIEENSEHFQTMFANEWMENKTNEIEINGYSYEAYYQYIRSLYTDYIETEDIEVLIELLSITEEYLDENMKLKCVEKIKPLIKVTNVCTLYSCALKYRSKELEDYSFELMSDNIKTISKNGDFEKMDSNYAKHFSNKYFQLK